MSTVVDHSCPVIVLDDVKNELWEIAHGLGVSGLPIMPHLVVDGKLERIPTHPHEGVRVLFTDLHILGPTASRPEQYISALAGFIKQLINPTTYLIVFWSAYPQEAETAWSLLESRLKAVDAEHLIPFAYSIMDKTEVMNISDEDNGTSAKATESVTKKIKELFDQYPQMNSLMQWESCVSRAASATSNELIQKLNKGGIPFTDNEAVKNILKRMSQEALGPPHAPRAPTKGVYQALIPITQDWLNRESEKGALNEFLGLSGRKTVTLPTQAEGKPKLSSLLNDFFTHSEQPGLEASERGAVIRLPKDYLEKQKNGLAQEIGLTDNAKDWREALCIEFAHDFSNKSSEEQSGYKALLDPVNVYIVELSAECDYAQDKPRSHRFLLSLFVPSDKPKPFYQSKKGANDAIYVTPEITLSGVPGRLLISCRIFLTRPYRGKVKGVAVTRMRQEVLAEIAHLYATHMRRPGKIAFF